MAMRHRFITLCFTLVAVLSAAATASAGSPSAVTGRSVRLDTRPVWVIPTCQWLRDLPHDKAVDAAVGINLQYAFSFSRHTRYGRLYPHAYQGIGAGYAAFMPHATLGRPASLYIFQGSRITAFSPRLSLNYEWSFGLSAGWHKYHPADGFDVLNGAVGSKVNFYLNAGVMLDWRLSRRWHLNAGIDLSHYSDGNTNLPNAGINNAGLRAGVAYTFDPTDPRESCPLPGDFTRGMTWDVMAYGAARQRVLHLKPESDDGEELRVTIPGHFAVAGVSVAGMYRLDPMFAVGASADMQYDESANLRRYLVDGWSTPEQMRFTRQPLCRRISAGLAVHAELTMPIFTLNVGLGRNIIARGKDTEVFYQTLAVKSYVWRGLFVNTGYQLCRFRNPSNLMFGLGYTFGR